VGRVSTGDIARTGHGRSSLDLADLNSHNEVGSTAVLMNQCASDSSPTYAAINDG
jgi:hypothetical protein